MIQKTLREKFVCVVGNTHEWQNGRSPTRDWFMSIAEQLKPDIKNKKTAQGFYTITADGKPLTFHNNRNVERMQTILHSALEKFAQMTPSAVTIPEAHLQAPWSLKLPKGGHVVRVYCRIRPFPLGSDESNRNVAQDHLWVLPSDIEELIQNQRFSDALVRRISRFHLVDNVRGEPDHWLPEQVRSAVMQFSPSVSDSGQLRGTFRGSFSMANSDGLRTLRAELEGKLAIDKKTKTLISFQAFGEGKASGRSTYTPNPPAGEFPVVFAFVSADDEASKNVPPQAIFWGDTYMTGK